MSVRTIRGQVRPFGHRPGLALSKPNAMRTAENPENEAGFLTFSFRPVKAANGNCQRLTFLEPEAGRTGNRLVFTLQRTLCKHS
jgi:hypothetical protein